MHRNLQLPANHSVPSNRWYQTMLGGISRYAVSVVDFLAELRTEICSIRPPAAPRRPWTSRPACWYSSADCECIDRLHGGHISIPRVTPRRRCRHWAWWWCRKLRKPASRHVFGALRPTFGQSAETFDGLRTKWSRTVTSLLGPHAVFISPDNDWS